VFGANSTIAPVLVPLFWIAAWIGASVIFRLSRGKPLWPSAPPNPRFVERYASGNCLDTLWGRLGGARNCLLVTLSETELYVTPQFPFNLMFLPEIYGLEAHVPYQRIRSCTLIDRWYGKSVRIEFTRSSGSDSTFSLLMRKRKEFLATLDSLLPGPSNQRLERP
jgi:hypothetical protein